MSNLIDEKYKIASIVQTFNTFTSTDLGEYLQKDDLPDTVYSVIAELLEKEYIETSSEETLDFNPHTLGFDKKVVRIYKVLPEKRKDLAGFVAELGKQRLQPNEQGRPQGLSYRVLEQLIAHVVATKALEEREIEIKHYLGLAREEELARQQSNPRQREISEAYIRVLYGQYLDLKSDWIQAILQLLTASQIFGMHHLETQQNDTEQRACKIFTLKYQQAWESNANYGMGDLLEVRDGVEEIKQIISRKKDQLLVFFALVDNAMKEIKKATTTPSQRGESVVMSLASSPSTPLKKLAEQPPIELRLPELEPALFSPIPYLVTELSSFLEKAVDALTAPFSQSKEQYIPFDLLPAFAAYI